MTRQGVAMRISHPTDAQRQVLAFLTALALLGSGLGLLYGLLRP